MKKATKKQVLVTVLAEAYKEWQDAPYGYKAQTLKKWADVLGMDEKILYRKLEKLSKLYL